MTEGGLKRVKRVKCFMTICPYCKKIDPSLGRHAVEFKKKCVRCRKEFLVEASDE